MGPEEYPVEEKIVVETSTPNPVHDGHEPYDEGDVGTIRITITPGGDTSSPRA